MTHTDEIIENKFEEIENNILLYLKGKFKEIKFTTEFMDEKLKLSLNYIQSFCHEYVYGFNKEINYDIMRKFVIESIVKLF